MVGGYVMLEVEFNSATDAFAAIRSGTNKVDRFGLFNKILNAWRTGKMVLYSTRTKEPNIALPSVTPFPIFPINSHETESEIDLIVCMAPCLNSDSELHMGRYTFRKDGTYDVAAF